MTFKDGAATQSAPVTLSGVRRLRHGDPRRSPAARTRSPRSTTATATSPPARRRRSPDGEPRRDHDDDRVRHVNPSTFGQAVTFNRDRDRGLSGSGDRHGGTVTVPDRRHNFGGPVTAQWRHCYQQLDLHPDRRRAPGRRGLQRHHELQRQHQHGGIAAQTGEPGDLHHDTHVVRESVGVRSVGHPDGHGEERGHRRSRSATSSFIEGGTCASPGRLLQANQAVNASGVVTYTSSAFSVAAHSVIACYDGSAGFAASQATLTQTVNKAATTTTITLRHARSVDVGPGGHGQLRRCRDRARRRHADGQRDRHGERRHRELHRHRRGGHLLITLNTAGARTLTATYAGDGSFTGSASAGAAHRSTCGHRDGGGVVAQPVHLRRVGHLHRHRAPAGQPGHVGSVTFIEGGTCAAPTTTLQAATGAQRQRPGDLRDRRAQRRVAHRHCLLRRKWYLRREQRQRRSDRQRCATALAVGPATGTFGGNVALSATLTSGGNPVSGKSVAFTLNGTAAGSATTNASGVASHRGGEPRLGINAGHLSHRRGRELRRRRAASRPRAAPPASR